jgi:hypothetical protein
VATINTYINPNDRVEIDHIEMQVLNALARAEKLK